MRISRGRRRSGRCTSACADNRDRRNLDCDGERQSVGAQRRTGVLSGLAKHFDQEIRRSVDDFRLVAEVVGRKHISGQLQHLLDMVEAHRGLHLGEEVERAQARRGLGLLHAHLVGAATCHSPAGLDGNLPGDEQQRPVVADRHKSGRNIRGHRSRRSGQLETELAKAVMR
jgi:hypothetical protein